MQDKATFEYAIIRLVPKVERAEFFNVGVILFSKPKKYLGIKFKVDETKLAAYSEELDLNMVNEYLDAWKMVCEGYPKGGKIGELELADRFRWLTASRSTIIQSSKTHPGLSNDPKTQLEQIFDCYVL
jgi:hypothetical protein